jgi:CYTH domain-containing protein
MKRERRFLLDDFPPGLMRNSAHLQITDNFVSNTRLRLRKIRTPETKERRWFLSRKVHPVPGTLSASEDVTMELSAYEYEVLAVFEGNEIRKNRYEYDHDGRSYFLDLYLGPLWGLIIAKTLCESDDDPESFPNPAFAVADVSEDPMFSAPRLAELTIEEIRRRFP